MNFEGFPPFDIIEACRSNPSLRLRLLLRTKRQTLGIRNSPEFDPQSRGNFSRVRNIYIDRGSALEVFETLSTARVAIAQRRLAIREETEEKHQLLLAEAWLSALSTFSEGTIEEDDITPIRRRRVIQLLEAALPMCKVDRDAEYFRDAIKECG